ncbi:hypothetical protein QQ73_18760, partial [Candidatus Endoriftia persephone str. Guaymas]|nr:hypothetical protein [Candidatus Endoriftia persephone str. Guaymas]
ASEIQWVISTPFGFQTSEPGCRFGFSLSGLRREKAATLQFDATNLGSRAAPTRLVAPITPYILSATPFSHFATGTVQQMIERRRAKSEPDSQSH